MRANYEHGEVHVSMSPDQARELKRMLLNILEEGALPEQDSQEWEAAEDFCYYMDSVL